MDVYKLVRHQIILGGMGDLVDINHHAVVSVLNLLEVDNPREMFFKIIECFNLERKIGDEYKGTDI